MHFNFDMRIFMDDNLSIFCQPCLSIICMTFTLKFHFIFHIFITQACFLFHQLKLKTHKTALSQINEWKYLIESSPVRQILNILKISFHTEPRSRLWHWEPHISDKIDRKYFIRQWLLVAGLQTNISQRKHFRILPSFVIHRDWSLNGTVWIKNDPEFIISLIYCRCFPSFDKTLFLTKQAKRWMLQIINWGKHCGSVKRWQTVRIRYENLWRKWEGERERRNMQQFM